MFEQLLLILYINDLSYKISQLGLRYYVLFTDDTTVLFYNTNSRPIELKTIVNNELSNISESFLNNRFVLNLKKNMYCAFSLLEDILHLSIFALVILLYLVLQKLNFVLFNR